MRLVGDKPGSKWGQKYVSRRVILELSQLFSAQVEPPVARVGFSKVEQTVQMGLLWDQCRFNESSNRHLSTTGFGAYQITPPPPAILRNITQVCFSFLDLLREFLGSGRGDSGPCWRCFLFLALSLFPVKPKYASESRLGDVNCFQCVSIISMKGSSLFHVACWCALLSSYHLCNRASMCIQLTDSIKGTKGLHDRPSNRQRIHTCNV